MRKKRHAITDIVGAVYCEQKVFLDRERGDAAPWHVRVKATTGRIEHKRFEAEGRFEAAVDQRCFIATAIYGGDAPQTKFLRAWRDTALMPSCLGRMLVQCYYRLSPILVLLVSRSPRLANLVRALLNRLLKWLNF